MTYTPCCAEEAQFLKDYDPTQYRNPAIAADTALFAVGDGFLSVLLIRRGAYPYKGCWALPGGFVDLDEDIAASAARELWEETGIADVYAEQVFAWGRPDRDPRQRVITVSFAGLVDRANMNTRVGDDAAQAEWFCFTDYTAEESGGIVQVRYTLAGCETLHPVVAYPSGRMQQITAVQSGGLAFDHAESLAYSYAYLRRRARSGLLELAFEDANLRKIAAKALRIG